MPIDWIRADWPAPPTLVAGTSTRHGGVSRGRYESLNLGAHVGDDADAVARNRRRLIKECQIPNEPRWLRQVHGDRVVADDFDKPPAAADASVSSRGDDVLVIMSADCLPVVLFAASGNQIAAAHCGWRSLSAGILDKTVSAMECDPSNVHAWLGPAISQVAFEVGDEVRDAFVSMRGAAADYFEHNARGRWQADLYGLARLQLRAAGACGRMATFIFRRDEDSQV